MNTTQPTDTQLKQTLAKMLPPKTARWTEDYYSCGMGRTYVENLWWIDPSDSRDNKREVLDTELLHLCWLVEETFNDKEIDSYLFRLDDIVEQPPFRNRISAFRYHATWQQRVIALAKVKGIEIL